MNAEEFLAAKLQEVNKQLSGAILNRGVWSALCDDRRMLQFLELRSRAPDFSNLERELRCIADGQETVPGISGPRRKATGCLHDWADSIKVLV
jgi:hypothetical protein